MRWLVLAATLVVASRVDAQPDPVSVSLPTFSCASSTYGVRLPEKLSSLRSIGILREEKVVHVQEWEGYKAVEKYLRFDGLSVQVITFTNEPDRYNLAVVSIESPSWSVSPFLVGQPSQPLLRRLGAKPQERTGAWRFGGESDFLYVEAREGKVFRVVYECYTG